MSAQSSNPEGESSLDTEDFETEFAAFVGAADFPCLPAKAAFNSGSYVVRAYDQLASPDSTRALGQALEEFTKSEMRHVSEYATFLAVFREPRVTSEREFERLLWLQLQQLNQLDRKEGNAYDPSVSSDPSNPHFAFSFNGEALFVVGMHAKSSRFSRQFPWPALIFNPHEQFERLRRSGKWNRMQDTIRTRDIALQGHINPMLDDFGDSSESRQYSGRAVEENWHAPFESQSVPPETKPGCCPFAPQESMTRRTIPPQSGTAFELGKGQHLRVIDLLGEQVADLVAFAREDKREWLSSGRSIDYANTIYLTTGHLLYSNRSRPMFTIVQDDVGRHDFLLTPCSPETFQIIYQKVHYHPSCFENLSRSLARYHIEPDEIPTTLNLFMNVEVEPNGKLGIHPPRSKSGDKITLRAEMDLIVGLTACSAELSNNYSFKPIGFEILEGELSVSSKYPR